MVWLSQAPPSATLTTSQPASEHSPIIRRQPPQGQLWTGRDESTHTRYSAVSPLVTAAAIALASAHSPCG